MVLAQIKNEAACLPLPEQRELIAFLVALQTGADAEFKAKLAAKIDDRDPTPWLELNEARKRCGE